MSSDRSAASVRRVPARVWRLLGFAFPGVLLLLLLHSQVATFATVSATLIATAAMLLAWLSVLLYWQQRHRTVVQVTFAPLAPHYVQACVQLCIYAYWGWYWRPVYQFAGLIVAQIALAYSLDMLLSLTRRRQWTIGFGPFPIIFSTNLFLLFKPEWFYLQFVMVAVGILGKEFIRWERDGKNTHIFNPSALSLFVFSLVLIVTNTTQWSFAEEIATTLNRPPNIYLAIFLLGLIVQGLFSVTLVTLMSALALIALNLAYTGFTGTYFFIDSNIPIAVFLGLHLLITDPATSPRTAIGKATFGVFYGAGVFLLYGLLGMLGAPTFYDKLLCVPILNLLVPWIDTMARRIRPVAEPGKRRYSDISARANRIHMFAWVLVFGVMLGTGFVGRGHPGNSSEFWKDACDRNLRNGCITLYDVSRNNCRDGASGACMAAAALAKSNPLVADPLEEGKLVSRACDLGRADACDAFREYVANGGRLVLDQSCESGDAVSCLISGMVSMFGISTPVDAPAALASWDKACEGRNARACGYLGEAYLLGRNVSENPETAAAYLQTACMLDNQPACTTLGLMYRRGHGVSTDAVKAAQLLETACQSGWQPACENLR